MKKDIFLGLLVIVSALSLTFGYYQKSRADRATELANKNAEIARKMTEIAEQHRKLAELQMMLARQNEMEAIRQRQMAKKN